MSKKNADGIVVTGFAVTSLNRVRPTDGPFQIIGIDQDCNECSPRRTAPTFKRAVLIARALCKKYGINPDD